MYPLHYATEINRLLEQANLSDSDKEIWTYLLSEAGEEAEVLFLDLFLDDSETLIDTTKSLRLQYTAKETGTDLSTEITDQELALLFSDHNS